jgi:hypothetical protein
MRQSRLLHFVRNDEEPRLSLQEVRQLARLWRDEAIYSEHITYGLNRLSFSSMHEDPLSILVRNYEAVLLQACVA